jgi:hypothetical protein
LALVAAYAIALNAVFLAYAPLVPAGAGPLVLCAPSSDRTQQPHRVPDHFGCAICPLAHGAPLTLSGATIVLLGPASMRLALSPQPAPRSPSKNRLPVARGPPLAA